MGGISINQRKSLVDELLNKSTYKEMSIDLFIEDFSDDINSTKEKLTSFIVGNYYPSHNITKKEKNLYETVTNQSTDLIYFTSENKYKKQIFNTLLEIGQDVSLNNKESYITESIKVIRSIKNEQENNKALEMLKEYMPIIREKYKNIYSKNKEPKQIRKEIALYEKEIFNLLTDIKQTIQKNRNNLQKQNKTNSHYSHTTYQTIYR